MFAFYLGKDNAARASLSRAFARRWTSAKEILIEDFFVVIPDIYASTNCVVSQALTGAIFGYVKREGLSRSSGLASAEESNNSRFFHEVKRMRGWPLGGEWTGSFAAVCYDAVKRELTLCNDPIGYFPLYYTIRSSGVFGATTASMLASALGLSPDIVGIVQRLASPNESTYGRRSTVGRVTRLLPGERIVFTFEGKEKLRDYDNSLGQNLIDGSLKDVARQVWDAERKEILQVAGSASEVMVGMSAGWDSRHVLAGLAHRGSSVHCVTYGAPEIYEAIIAERCARAVGASHEVFDIKGLYFPDRDSFYRYVSKTEAGTFIAWHSFLSRIQKADGALMLLGDHLESVDGRHVLEFSSREARKRLFVDDLIGRPERHQPLTTASLTRWEAMKRSDLRNQIRATQNLINPDLYPASIEDESMQDLEELFSRIRAHLPPLYSMLEEQFRWLTFVRSIAASQNVLLHSRFRAYSPAMALGFVRLISCVHPRLRILRRLIDEVAWLPEFKQLSEIPSAQIPFMSARAPRAMRFLWWGARSGMDQILIRRMLRHRDTRLRQRVLPTIDFLSEYMRPETANTVQSWYNSDIIKGDVLIERFRRRASLQDWPLIHADLASAASVSLAIEACTDVAV